MSNIEFDRLEEYEPNSSIICSFKTDRFGYVQVRMKRMPGTYLGESSTTWKFETLAQEPDLNMFTKKQLHHMEKQTRIIWRMVYDTPAAKHRFKR